ncbi:MAG: glycoside hydrolase family 65 protein [Clostridia bacterium]
MEQNKFDPQAEKHFEGAFTQGNGYFHLRGSYEEGLPSAKQDEAYMRMPANVTIEKPRAPLSKVGTYIPGITGRHPLLNEEMVNLPFPAAVHIAIDSTMFSMQDERLLSLHRWLDLRDGVLHRCFVLRTAQGCEVEALFSRYPSKAMPGLLVQEMCFTAKHGQCSLELKNDINEQVRTNGFDHFFHVKKEQNAQFVSIALQTDQGDHVHMVSILNSQTDTANRYSVQLHSGQTIKLSKYTLLSTSRDHQGLLTLEQMLEMLKTLDTAVLYSQHEALWQSMWHAADVTIAGDDEAQLALRFSIYHLLRCANEQESRVAICAKGFSGEAYFGHFFWDSEIYLQPFYLHTLPQMGKNLSLFRVHTLSGAIENAKKYGYEGARYPWESSVTGEEQCPNWQYADHEIHITADVVYGIWNTWKTTGDDDFFLRCFPVLLQTARYWLSRVCQHADGSYHINGVMGPDEYILLSNDNAYTNTMVRESLRHTLEGAAWIGQKHASLAKTLQITNVELQSMEQVAKHLFITTDEKGIIAQCEHFDTMYEEPDFEHTWPDRSLPYGRAVSQEKNYRTKALKQADVLMLPYLYKQRFSKEMLQANYAYYEPNTTHDSSLSAIVHAILCCQMGRSNEAYDYFKMAMGTDIEKHGAGEGVHIANCAGIWQAVLYGFCGLGRLYEAHWQQLQPCLPAHWQAVRFRVIVAQVEYEITVTQEKVVVSQNPQERTN